MIHTETSSEYCVTDIPQQELIQTILIIPNGKSNLMTGWRPGLLESRMDLLVGLTVPFTQVLGLVHIAAMKKCLVIQLHQALLPRVIGHI